MSTIADNKTLTATWKNGQVVLDSPADWPEGCKLRVAAISQPAELIGIPDNQWPNDPQGITELLKRMDQIEPFKMTSEEEADWLAWRQKIKELELANFEKRIEGLFE
jgi:hypothetical protein